VLLEDIYENNKFSGKMY